VLSAYGNVRRDGIIALKITEGDDLIGAGLVDPGQDVMLATRNGQAVRFAEGDVRSMGRVSTGVKGVALREGDEAVEMVVLADEGTVLTVCQNGYGKRTSVDEYPRRSRGTMGVIDIKTTERNGPVVSCMLVEEDDEVMIVTQKGVMIRTPVEGINTVGRNTQGVRVINVDEGDHVIDLTRVVREEEEEELAEAAEAAQEEEAPASGAGAAPEPALADLEPEEEDASAEGEEDEEE
jgi:DNA gyrase subunit A